MTDQSFLHMPIPVIWLKKETERKAKYIILIIMINNLIIIIIIIFYFKWFMQKLKFSKNLLVLSSNLWILA